MSPRSARSGSGINSGGRCESEGAAEVGITRKAASANAAVPAQKPSSRNPPGGRQSLADRPNENIATLDYFPCRGTGRALSGPSGQRQRAPLYSYEDHSSRGKRPDVELYPVPSRPTTTAASCGRSWANRAGAEGRVPPGAARAGAGRGEVLSRVVYENSSQAATFLAPSSNFTPLIRSASSSCPPFSTLQRF